MSDAHAGLRITAASFDLAVDLLKDALVAAEVEPEDVDTIIHTVNKLKGQIVGQ
jgi:3-oxoacyl-[acyl-carrier-protein] synthase III